MLTHRLELAFDHRVYFTRGVADPGNAVLDRALLETPRALAVVEEAVAAARPGWTTRLAARLGSRLVADPYVCPGGEACKNDDRTWREVTGWIEAHGIDRHNAVICVGGGALLDAVGLAAATAHRGVRLVRVPTTVLAQADSGVGVKNAVNAFGKKNFLGTFAVPYAVIDDFEFLQTLPPDEARAGLVEAVKVALIKDHAFFDWLEKAAGRLHALDAPTLEEAVRRSATLHFEHICAGGDPFELGSSRPLDFGHWAAHKLESLTGHAVGHGQAVSIGVALDTLCARETGLLDPVTAARVLDLLARLGLPRFHPALGQRDAGGRLVVLDGLDEFRQHLGGRLTVLLPVAPGRAVEVHEVGCALVERCIDLLRTLEG